MTAFSFKIPDDLRLRAAAICAERGTTIEDYLLLCLRRLTRRAKYFGLDDTLTFGKYRTELVEEVMRNDPKYIIWCLHNVDGFVLTPTALDLLHSLDTDFALEEPW